MLRPIVEEIKLNEANFYDIAEYFHKEKKFVFLDSRLRNNGLGMHSFISFEPFLTVKSKNDVIWYEQSDGKTGVTEGSIFNFLKSKLEQYNIVAPYADDIAPFLGGVIGYFGYELNRQIEVLPKTAVDQAKLPESLCSFYNFVIILNHETEKLYVSYIDIDIECPINSIDSLKNKINSVPKGFYNSQQIDLSSFIKVDFEESMEPFKSDFTETEYCKAIKKIKEYIAAGDIYQANLTQRFQVEVSSINTWHLYKRLMKINPAPFASYLNFDEVCVVSSSPERFVLVKDRYVETRPIKGTIQKGATLEEEKQNIEKLFNSSKDRAELAMIVDLMRNDIGRSCEIGSVLIKKKFPELESYPSLHHLVSTIIGTLDKGKNVIDLLESVFPGGSMTGAPKIRAMEIIDELEPVERSIYSGSIGYIGFNQKADLNIVIRTIIIINGVAYIQVGGGIVADSVAIDEYQETLTKAKNLFKSLVVVNERS